MTHAVIRTGKPAIDLDLPKDRDGVPLRQLPREQVERHLLNLKIPGIIVGQGRDAMLETYCYHLVAQEEGEL